MTMARYNDTFVLSEAKKLLDTTIAGMCSETVLEGEGACVAGQMPLAMYPKGGFCDMEHSCAKSKAMTTDLGTVFCKDIDTHPPFQPCPRCRQIIAFGHGVWAHSFALSLSRGPGLLPAPAHRQTITFGRSSA